MDSSEKTELKERVESRRKELEAELERLKADARADARERQRGIEGKLHELQSVLKTGWDRVSEGAARRLNEWLR